MRRGCSGARSAAWASGLRSTPRGIGAAIGVATHHAAELILKEKARSGTLPPSTVATDAAAESLAEGVRQGVEYDRVSANRAEAEAQVINLARSYHRHIAPQVQPVAVEEQFEAEVIPGLVLSGRPDLVCREPGAIRDLKTSTRTGGSHWPQIGGYSLVTRSNGLDIERASVDSIKRVPVNKAQPDPESRMVPLAPAETAASNILRAIVSDLKTFREGDLERRILPGDAWSFQANPHSTLCSAKYCPAHGTEFCHEWQGNE